MDVVLTKQPLENRAVGTPPPRKRPKKKTIVLGAVAVLVIAAALVTAILLNMRNATGAEESVIMEATVSTGDVSTTIEGTGTLAYGSTTALSLPSGVEVEEVYVAVGDTVSSGDVLAKLEEYSLKAALLSAEEALSELESDIGSTDSSTSEYYQLLKEQKDTQEAYAILAMLATSNTITATSDGVITAVEVYANTEAGESNPSDSSSSSDSPSSDGLEQASASQGALAGIVTADYALEDSSAAAAEATGTGVYSTAPTSSDSPLILLADSASTLASLNLDGLKLAPRIGETPLTTIAQSTYTAEVSWSPSDTAFEEGVAYTATVSLTPLDGYSFPTNPSVTLTGAETVSYTLEGNGTLSITAVFAALAAPDTNPNDNNNNNNSSGNTPSGSSPSSSLSSSGGSSLSSSANSSSGSGDDTAANNTQLYTAFEVAAGDGMNITASIDEMDINSVEVGQSVRVTLSALEGEEFEGEITKVIKSNSGSGSSAKYSVEIALPRTEAMLAGMSASVSIVISESTGTLSIPSAALQQEGGRAFVYTQKDEATGELSGEVEIEIGNSDGSVVEILSGVEEGTVVYYEAAVSNESMSMGFSGGGPNFSANDGEMPSMGARPEGGSTSSPTMAMPGGER